MHMFTLHLRLARCHSAFGKGSTAITVHHMHTQPHFSNGYSAAINELVKERQMPVVAPSG